MSDSVGATVPWVWYARSAIPDFQSGRAACAGTDPDAWVAEDNENQALLDLCRKICAGCPVRDECLAYARANRVAGVWGGTTERERELLDGVDHYVSNGRTSVIMRAHELGDEIMAFLAAETAQAGRFQRCATHFGLTYRAVWEVYRSRHAATPSDAVNLFDLERPPAERWWIGGRVRVS